MALDIQPVNYGGLAQVAGKSNPMGNLQPTGALGLQALQQMQAAAASQRSDATNRMQIQQQGQLALGQQGIQRAQLAQQAAAQERAGLFQDKELAYRQQHEGQQLSFDRDKSAMLQQQGNQQNALGMAGMDVRKQELGQEQQKMEYAKLMNEKKEVLQEKGAFASYGLMSLSSAKSPEEAQQISDAIFKEAVDKGYLPKDQAEKMNQLPLSQRMNLMKGMIVNAGMAKETKDAWEAGQPKAAAAGGNVKYVGADGSVFEMSQPTTPVKGEFQKKVAGAESNLAEIDYLRKNVSDRYFGAMAGVEQGATSWGEWGQDIPGLGPLGRPSDESKADNTKYNELQGTIKNLSMNIIKDLSGLSYTDKQLEFMNDIVPQIGGGATKSQFDGKLDNLERYMKRVKEANKEILRSGLGITEGSEEHKNALMNKMIELKRSFSEKPQFTREQIDAERARRAALKGGQ